MKDNICLDTKFSTTQNLYFLEDTSHDFEERNHVLSGGLRSKGYYKKELNGKPLVTIVTVVFNGEHFLKETIESVINQHYDNIEYIIIDGGSTDNTVNIIEKYNDKIDFWASEKDTGMYDALKKGFSLASGSIISWLNADDLYYPWTVVSVVNIFKKFEINWLTGIPTVIDSQSHLISVEFPKSYFRRLIKRGAYRGDCLGFIQQESTFFSKTLYDKVKINSSRKLAGDYELWINFAKYTKLFSVNIILASFRIHDMQQSADISKYYTECNLICRKPLIRIFKPLIKLYAVFHARFFMLKNNK